MDGNEHHLRIPSIIWIPLIICVALLFILDVFQIRTYTIPTPTFRTEELPEDPQLLKGFLIKNEGCRIPYMDPFDKSVVEFIENEARPNCSEGKPPLYEINDNTLYLVNNSLQSYNIENVSNLSCCYRPFWRKNPQKSEKDDKFTYSDQCKKIGERQVMTDEFIKLTCVYGNDTVYTDYYAFVPLKPNVTIEEERSENNAGPVLNVLLVGLDAVSRVNLHRQMPKTVEYLESISATELLGYNKVADNTFPNLIPVLTGLSEDELRTNCWHNNEEHFDKCPFIWKTYKERGYVTSFGEDSAWMGIFTYLKNGFIEQPTDYAYSNFNHEAEKKIGNQHRLNVNHCVGPREVYKTLLDYITRFVTKMHSAKRKYFAFFWGASLSHDFLNMPKLGDEDYKKFFQNLKESGKLNNTALVFMSDHGIRWGGIRQTYQGRLEERLPFVYLVLPDWFRDQYSLSYKNLQKNVRRLTTPFDLHETIVQFLNFTEDNLHNYEKSRGYSLFSEITPKRTCTDAGITSHWCTCQQSYEVGKNSSVVRSASQAVVDHMNSLLQGYAQCSNLTLKSIIDSRLMSHGEHILSEEANYKDYTVTIQTEPGDGVFESTVRNHVSKNSSRFEIMGTISRLNLYGKQSSCVTDFHMKLYCYCKSLLSGFGF